MNCASKGKLQHSCLNGFAKFFVFCFQFFLSIAKLQEQHIGSAGHERSASDAN